MPTITYPEFTMFAPDGTTFTITLDQILGVKIAVAVGKVIGLDPVTYYLIKQDLSEVAITNYGFHTIQSMLATKIAGSAPTPVTSRTEIDTMANNSGVFREWLVPLVLSPPTP